MENMTAYIDFLYLNARVHFANLKDSKYQGESLRTRQHVKSPLKVLDTCQRPYVCIFLHEYKNIFIHSLLIKDI